MTTYNFEASRDLPADPATIYRAWRSSGGHSAMTRALESVDPDIGGASAAWNEASRVATLNSSPSTTAQKLPSDTEME